MDLNTLFHSEMDRHEQAFRDTRDQLSEPFAKWVDICCKSLKLGGKILFFGNGGSASDAQHLATELTVRYVKKRKALAALALTTDTSSLTAIGNDFGFEDLFSRQVEALCTDKDVCIGISTSGTSPNVIKALKTARDLGAKTVGLGGRDGGVLSEICDVSLIIPHNETARIQEMHITLGHALCQALDNEFSSKDA